MPFHTISTCQKQLTYQPKACYACGHVFDDQIIKHGLNVSH
ncbi:hypothetical protein [Ureibacillus sp. FSL W8-0352]